MNAFLKSNLEFLRNSFKRESSVFGLPKALDSLVNVFELNQPNFVGFLIKPPERKTIVITTEGQVKSKAPQYIRVPENILDFPLEAVVHLLKHEFIHVEQRNKSNYTASRAVREFEAYYSGIYDNNSPIPCPENLKAQFRNSLLKYYHQMSESEKAVHAVKFHESQRLKA